MLHDTLSNLEANGKSGAASSSMATSDRQERQRMARERAMAAMKQQQSSFQASLSANSSTLLDVSENETPESENTRHEDEMDSPGIATSCILCQENTGKPIGYIAFIQRSEVLQHSNKAHVNAAHIQFCGHCLHFCCKDAHMAALRKQHAEQHEFEGRHVVDLEAGEFLCPLCKAIGNAVVAHCSSPTLECAEMQTGNDMSDVCEWFTSVRVQLSSFSNASGELQVCQLPRQIASIANGNGNTSSDSMLSTIEIMMACWETITTAISGIHCEGSLPASEVPSWRSLILNIRSLSSLLQQNLELRESVVAPLENLLHGSIFEIQGPSFLNVNTVLGMDLFALLAIVLMLVPPEGTYHALQALYIVAVVQATLAVDDHPASPLKCTAEKHEPEIPTVVEEGASELHQFVCECAGVAPKFGSTGAAAAIQRRCSTFLARAHVLIQLLHGRISDIEIDCSPQKISALYSLPSLPKIAADLSSEGTRLGSIEFWIKKWCLAAGAGSGAVAAEQATRGTATWQQRQLYTLPHKYDDLYSRFLGQTCKISGLEPDDPAVCLVCGVLLCAGSACCKIQGRGSCTQHAETCGGGIGMFLLLKKCQVVLIRSRFASFYLSPYLDSHGEEDIGLRRGRPLSLNATRYDNLCLLWYNQLIARDVSRTRNQSERVIRQNYF